MSFLHLLNSYTKKIVSNTVWEQPVSQLQEYVIYMWNLLDGVSNLSSQKISGIRGPKEEGEHPSGWDLGELLLIKQY